MIHNMLEYAEVQSDLRYVDISTTPLELKKSYHFNSREEKDSKDGASIEMFVIM